MFGKIGEGVDGVVGRLSGVAGGIGRVVGGVVVSFVWLVGWL